MELPTPSVVVLFLLALLANIGALSVLPLTQGFSRLLPTLICISLFIVNIFFLARLIHSGTLLSGLVPLMSGLIPLSMILVGVFFYGESGSPLRVALLVGACALVFVASTIENQNSTNESYDATRGEKGPEK